MTARWSTAALLFAVVFNGGCVRLGVGPASEGTAGQAFPDLRESEDVSNRIFGARIEKGRVVEFIAANIPAEAVSRAPFDKTKQERPPQDVTPAKIHPL